MGALTALAERGSSTWHPPFDEGPVVGTAFDDRVYDTRHLGGNGGHCLAAQIGIVPILGDIAFELVTEAVLPLADGDLSGDPKSAAQAGIAELGKSRLAAILTGLLCREIKAAELSGGRACETVLAGRTTEIIPFSRSAS